MRVRVGLLGIAMVGCLQVPEDLQDLDTEVPLVPLGACAPNRLEIVSCVIDGGTVSVNGCDDGEIVHLLGVDAPRPTTPELAGECFGDNALAELTRLVDNEQVWLTFDKECLNADNDTQAYVWFGDTEGDGPAADALFLNEWMLGEGFVRLNEADGDLRLGARLAAATADAQARGIGLWSACGVGE